MSRKTKLKLIILFGVAVIAAIAGYLVAHNAPLLRPRGEIGQKERSLIIFALGLSLVVILPVYYMLFSFVWKYRETNKKPKKYRPDHDHSKVLEAIWWLIPGLLIFVLSIVAWNSSRALDPYKPLKSSTKPVTVQVVALQWKWLFIYPEQKIASVNLVEFPKNTPVNFRITADAPMNSFWIPQLGGQIYAMPGMTTQLHLNANKAGDYNGYSANISGDGFAGMTFTARATDNQSFNKWVESVKKSPNTLDISAYNRLAAPSKNNPVAYYSAKDSSLYDKIIAKFVVPGEHGHSHED